MHQQIFHTHRDFVFALLVHWIRLSCFLKVCCLSVSPSSLRAKLTSLLPLAETTVRYFLWDQLNRAALSLSAFDCNTTASSMKGVTMFSSLTSTAPETTLWRIRSEMKRVTCIAVEEDRLVTIQHISRTASHHDRRYLFGRGVRVILPPCAGCKGRANDWSMSSLIRAADAIVITADLQSSINCGPFKLKT